MRKFAIFFKLLEEKEAGGVVNSVVAIATAKTVIAKSDLEHLKALDLENWSWTKSLFQRMGFTRRAKQLQNLKYRTCRKQSCLYSALLNC